MNMSTQATIPPVIPERRKSRRGWYYFGGAILLLIAVPTAYYFIASWWRDRQLAELTQEIDEEDPTWRWPDLVAEMKPPPDEKNSAIQLRKARELLPQKNALSVGGKWENAPLHVRMLAAQAKLAASP